MSCVFGVSNENMSTGGDLPLMSAISWCVTLAALVLSGCFMFHDRSRLPLWAGWGGTCVCVHACRKYEVAQTAIHGQRCRGGFGEASRWGMKVFFYLVGWFPDNFKWHQTTLHLPYIRLDQATPQTHNKQTTNELFTCVSFNAAEWFVRQAKIKMRIIFTSRLSV